jgi:hypothetical protein
MLESLIFYIYCKLEAKDTAKDNLKRCRKVATGIGVRELRSTDFPHDLIKLK